MTTLKRLGSLIEFINNNSKNYNYKLVHTEFKYSLLVQDKSNKPAQQYKFKWRELLSNETGRTIFYFVSGMINGY